MPYTHSRVVLFSNVVMKSLTSVFRNIAYKRLLGAMYDSWLLGVKDKSVNLKRTPKGVGEVSHKQSKNEGGFRKVLEMPTLKGSDPSI